MNYIPLLSILFLAACMGKSPYEKLQNDPLIAPPEFIVYPFGTPEAPALPQSANWLAAPVQSFTNETLPLTGWLNPPQTDNEKLQRLFQYLETAPQTESPTN